MIVPQGWRLDLPDGLKSHDQWKLIAKITQQVEKLGYDSAVLYDHFHSYPIEMKESVFECFTTLTALAAITSKIRLGQLVSCNSYRNPAYLAKISSVLDVISNGRMEFGIGAGWHEREYSSFGYTYLKNSIRLEMLEEAVEIVKKMWTEEETSYMGKYYQIQGALNYPKPIQNPPKILIGGGGEKLTLKIVAKHADKSNFNAIKGIQYLKKKLATLKEYSKECDRDDENIEKTLLCPVIINWEKKKIDDHLKRTLAPNCTLSHYRDKFLIGTSENLRQIMEEFINLGFSNFFMYFPNAFELNPQLEFYKDVIKDLI